MAKGIHICDSKCNIKSHKAWNRYYPNDPILRREIIHHKNKIHEDDRKENLEKQIKGNLNFKWRIDKWKKKIRKLFS